MALKKSELYNSIWKSCDELRGGMDASQYKDYVLVLLFVKYVSDKYAGKPQALIEVPAGGGFADMVALKNDKEIGDKINKIIGRLADANDSLKGAINVADFNDEEKLGKGKEMVDRLTKLVAIFEGLDFGRNRAEGDDLLGDAYEYLMRHFATESGKSKGQFYTPAEVSRVMAMVIDLSRFATGISVYGVSKSNVRNIEFTLPKPEEQTAIATVLSDMDANITALEARREKTLALKQGMMQELLTGRIRAGLNGGAWRQVGNGQGRACEYGVL